MSLFKKKKQEELIEESSENIEVSEENEENKETAAEEIEPNAEEDAAVKQKEERFKKERKEQKVGLSRGELKKRLKYGSLSVVFTALVIAAIVVCNILVDLVASKIPAVNIDTTDKQYYELSDESIEYLKTLEEYEIEIIFIGDEKQLLKDQYYNKILKLAEKYKMYTPNLDISYMDIDKNPGFAADYDNIELTLGDALVVCGDRYRQLTSGDFIYTEDENENGNYYGTTDSSTVNYSLTAEYALSTAIMVVTASDNPKATVITGHGEQELAKLVRLLENNGYEVNSQSILKELDYTSNLLIIAAPTKDYSETDLKKLDDFLFNNGKYGKNVMYVADYTQPVLPNLEAFLHDWGFEISSGVVYESDESLAYANMPALNTLRFIDANLTLDSAFADVSAFGYYGRPAKIANVLDVNMENSIILQHTETSKVGNATANGFEKGENEAYPYIAMARTTLSKYSEEIEVFQSSLLFVNSIGFFEDELFEKSYSANPDVTIAAVDSMLGRDDVLLIPSKSLTAAALGITYAQANIIGSIAAVVIPVSLLVACLVVFIRRRFL